MAESHPGKISKFDQQNGALSGRSGRFSGVVIVEWRFPMEGLGGVCGVDLAELAGDRLGLR